MRRNPVFGSTLCKWLVPLLVAGLVPAAQAAKISNVRLEEGKKQVSVLYDLEGPGASQIRLVGSENGGRAFTLQIRDVSGDVGPGIQPGKDKQIIWKFLTDHPRGIQDKDIVLDVVTDPKPRIPKPGYFVIPLRGEVGWEITRAVLEDSLAEAAFLKAEVVVLEVTSPGGMVSELLDILDLLGAWQLDHPNQRLVAFVDKQAFSAAAVISAACKEIFLKPNSAIGAALAINVGAGGITSVEEKFSSAYRGKARAASEAAGHVPVIVEAMIDPDIEVSLAQALGPKGEDPSVKGRFLKRRGKLLTLTTGEAVECGLARGIARDYDELGAALGFKDWEELSEYGRKAVAAHEKERARIMADYEELVYRVTEGIEEFNQLVLRGASSRKKASAYLGDAWSIRKSVDEIEQLAAEYPVIAGKVRRRFPNGTQKLKNDCDDRIRAIKNQ